MKNMSGIAVKPTVMGAPVILNMLV